MNFLASPTIVTALAFSGKLSFNPQTDILTLPSGEHFKFAPPIGQDLPEQGFAQGDHTYYPAPNPKPRPEVQVVIQKDSQRLELLEPFSSHFVDSRMELPALKVLARIRGKCTTDHISAAVSPCLLTKTLCPHFKQGPWLKYKGHLTNISENLCDYLFMSCLCFLV